MAETEFFRALFSDVPEGHRILIWTLPEKRSLWAPTWEIAAAYAEQQGPTDVYVGVGLSSRDYGPKRRCSADEIAGIVGLWADVDIADPTAHKKTNLPPDQDAAMELLMNTGLAPTVTVHSGHGLQAWWLLREPWIFEDDQERQQAARLARRWMATLKARARPKGWDVDATGDLSRVLRVPGTRNTKNLEDVRPVKLLELVDGLRFNISDFEEWLIDDDAPGWTTAQPHGDVTITLNEVADPPFTKFQTLATAEPRLLKSFNHERRDLQDQSASAYDQSLATFAAMAGWTDQEICDLLVAHRRYHKEDLKRLDYYQRTISLARGNYEQDRAFDAIQDLTSSDDRPTDEVERRTAILEQLSKLLTVEIRHVIKHQMDPPRYRLETACGSIELGEVANLIGQIAFRNKLAAASSRYLPTFSKTRWATIAQWLLDVCEESVSSEEATDPGRGRAWLALYLSDHRPVDLEQAAARRAPYTKNGAVHVFSTSLKKWLNATQFEGIKSSELSITLKAAGCSPVTEHVPGRNGERTTAPAWRLPEEGGSG